MKRTEAFQEGWSPRMIDVPPRQAGRFRGDGSRLDVCFWQILLQKSEKAQRLISRLRTKQATIAD
jgi:hypothetical protein